MIDRLVILGAGGDLAARYLMPALAQILDAGEMSQEFSITGVAREEWSDEQFREHIGEQLGKHAADIPEESRSELLERLSYVQADVTSPDEVGAAFEDNAPVLAYLALPPAIFPGAIDALDEIGLAEGSRIVVEKPFGEDLESARSLNEQVHRVFPEGCVHRIDHFLGMQTVQNILGLRFANRIFEPLWHRDHILQVEIIWDETLALEGRAGYYDSAGALKDMIQNHLLQLLCFVAMEAPEKLDEQGLRDRKHQLLCAVRRLSVEEVASNSYRARYTSGEVNGREIPAYVDEEGVEPERNTETFAELRLEIDNERWSGVPFVLRSGKALGRDRRMIKVHFRDSAYLQFGDGQRPGRNVLRMEIDPDRLHLDINVSCPGDLYELRSVDLNLELRPPVLPAYGTLLLDALHGEPMLFIRDDEAEEAWRIVEPVLQAWSDDLVPLHEYAAGTDVQTGMLIDPGSDSSSCQ